MRPFARHGTAALVVLLLAAVSGPVAAAPEGTLTWGVHVTLAARWLDPSDTEAFIAPFKGFAYSAPYEDLRLKPGR